MRKLGLHVGGYTVLLVVVMAFIPLDSSFSSDAGAYGGQVYALEQGAWALPRPLPVVDLDNEGWLNSAITPAGPTPYTANPAYAVLLWAVARAVSGSPGDGEGAGSMALGLHVVPLLGAVASAVAAWLLAARWDRRAAPLAFWLLALGPVLVQATTLWAHTMSTALGGLALLLALRATETARRGGPEGARGETAHRTGPGGAAGRSGWRGERGGPLVIVAEYLGATVLLIGCALIRTEAVFWIVAVSATALAAAWFHRSPALAASSTGGAIVATAAWIVNREWGQSLRADRLPIETSAQALSEQPGWLVSRIPAGWQLLLSSLAGGPGPVLTLAALGLGALGALRMRRSVDERSRHLASALLVAAAGLYAVRIVLAPDAPISGTLGAWPLLLLLPLASPTDDHRSTRPTHAPPSPPARSRHGSRQAGDFGVGWVAPESIDGPSGRRPIAAVGHRTPGPGLLVAPPAMLVVAVLATQYANSGGLQWGGRYLSLAFAPLAAAAAIRGHHTFRRVRPLAALLVVPALAGITVSYQLHHLHRDVIDATIHPPAEVVITEHAAVPRIAWPALPTTYYRASGDDVELLLTRLADAGVTNVNVHGLGDVEVSGMGGFHQTERRGPVRHLTLVPPSATTAPTAVDPGP